MAKKPTKQKTFVLRGDRLEEALRLRNKKQMDLVNDNVISAPQIWRYLYGHGDPDLVTFRRLVDYLEISADFLLGRTDDPIPKQAGMRDSRVIVELLANALSDAELDQALDAFRIAAANRDKNSRHER
jgi:transcriptional regulator with XRE-family HTH domain